jgi:hypothetical protein
MRVKEMDAARQGGWLWRIVRKAFKTVMEAMCAAVAEASIGIPLSQVNVELLNGLPSSVALEIIKNDTIRVCIEEVVIHDSEQKRKGLKTLRELIWEEERIQEEEENWEEEGIRAEIEAYIRYVTLRTRNDQSDGCL